MPAHQKKVDLDEVEKYARLGLSMNEIARCMGIAPSTLYDKMQKQKQKGKIGISERIEAGRASLVASCAQVIVKAAVGEPVMLKDPKTGRWVQQKDSTGKPMYSKEADPKYALEVARKFGEGWKDKPLVEVGGDVKVEATIVAQQLGDETCERMAQLFLKSRGKL